MKDCGGSEEKIMAPIVQTDEAKEFFFPFVGQVGERNLSVIFLCSVCRSPPHKTVTLPAMQDATVCSCLFCH